MIWKDYTYKWFSFSDDLALVNNLVLHDVKKSISLRTNIYEKNSYHWTNSSLTLWSGRVITFTWKIFGISDEERANWQDRLNAIIRPEWIFTDDKWFYELSWYEDNWQKVKAQAKVYSMPTYNTEVWSKEIDFSFDLYVENSTFQWYEDKSNKTIATTIMWWHTLPMTLPAILNWYIIITFTESPITDVEWEILTDVELNEILEIVQEWAWSFPNANNLWNFEAPCRIELVWDLVNPKITNLANWRFYWLNTTISSLVLDNTWKEFIVEDNWINVKQYRQTWSKQLFLSPGVNEFIVYADNLSINTNYQITIYFNDTYINS